LEEYFEYNFRASGGWAKARLTLSDDIAQIEYDSAGMGQVPVRYIIHCEHKKFSDFYGLLSMSSIEQYGIDQNEFGGYIVTDTKEVVSIGRLIEPDADDEMLDVLNTLDIEYVRLPQPQIRLEEPGGNWGVHERTDTFSLILMIHFAGFWYEEAENFEKTPLGRGLRHLDKMHFAISNVKSPI
jgi:hypothetical protein